MLDQDSYRFRNDNGSETTATWMAATNAAPPEFDPDVDTDFRLRFRLEADAFSDFPGLTLQYNKNGAGWTNVTTSSSVIRAIASANFNDADVTTEQIGSGDFVEGFCDEDGSVGGVSQSSEIKTTEHEFMLRCLAADVTPPDIVELRLATLDTYTRTPQIHFEQPISGPNPAVLHSAAIMRRLRTLRCMYRQEVEPLYTGSEVIDIDKWSPQIPEMVRRNPWRPEGYFAYTEVPVLPDVIEHGWEVPLQLQMRWQKSRQQHLAGTHVVQPVLTGTALAIACVGELRVTPKWLGELRVTPKWVGELDINIDGDG